MHPTICAIGPFTVYSYGLMLAVAFLLASSLAGAQARAWRMDPEIIFSLSFWSFLTGIIGARALFVISHAPYYLEHPRETMLLTHGGLSIFGGLIAGVACAILYIRSKKLSALRVLDLLMPFLALGQAIGRIGCFLNGCCYGRETAAGIMFPGESVARIPTQIYSSFALLGIFVILRILQDRPHATGSIVWWYLVLYGIKRFIIESFRADNPPVIGWMTLYHVMSIAFILVGIVGLVCLKRNHGRSHV